MPTTVRTVLRRPGAPPGLDDHVSRREAAELLGFGSDFKVRQLEKAGHLSPVRGAMGQAWYPRSRVLELRADFGGAGFRQPSGRSSDRGTNPKKAERWSDAALIAYLRGTSGPAAHTRPSSGPTVVDLVADTGVSIARAERIYRFWLANDRHPSAESRRKSSGLPPKVPAFREAAESTSGLSQVVPGVAESPEQPSDGSLAPPLAPKSVERLGGASLGPGISSHSGSGRRLREAPDKKAPGERRAQTRLERAVLIRRLRDPDPMVRAEAFDKLRQLRVPGEDDTNG